MMNLRINKFNEINYSKEQLQNKSLKYLIDNNILIKIKLPRPNINNGYEKLQKILFDLNCSWYVSGTATINLSRISTLYIINETIYTSYPPENYKTYNAIELMFNNIIRKEL